MNSQNVSYAAIQRKYIETLTVKLAQIVVKAKPQENKWAT